MKTNTQMYSTMCINQMCTQRHVVDHPRKKKQETDDKTFQQLHKNLKMGVSKLRGLVDSVLVVR